MYDHLSGELVERGPGRIVLRAGGIGFEVRVPLGTLEQTPPGSPATLHTILHVVDGMPTLLGFATRAERELARKLMSVSGVGPALTLAMLSTCPPSDLQQAIVTGDLALLKSIKGIGNKTAERLCLELRDQVSRLPPGVATGAAVPPPQGIEDAVAALVTLGYGGKEAREGVRRARDRSPQATPEQLVKAVLRGGA
jgi:Holliday junction DNA helicase RuvA